MLPITEYNHLMPYKEEDTVFMIDVLQALIR